MKRVFNFILNKPIILLLAIIVVIFLPSAISAQPQSYNKLIVRSFSIDKEAGEYEFSVLAYVPRATQTFSENYQLMSGKGSTLTQAISNISKSTGKKVALAESNLILVNNEVCEYGLIPVLDYLVREYSLGNNSLVLSTGDSKAKDVLTVAKEIAHTIGISIQDIVEYDKEKVLSSKFCLEELYNETFSPGASLILEVITLKEDVGLEVGEHSQSSGSSDSSGSSSSSGGSSSDSSTSNKKLANEGNVIVLKDGKKVMDMSYEKVFNLNWGKNRKDFGVLVLENYNDAVLSNATISLYIFENKAKIKTRFEGDKPICEINIGPQLMIDEINQEEYSADSYNETYHSNPQDIRETANLKIGKDFSNVMRELIDGKIDLLNIHENFLANKTQKFKEYLNNLEFEDDYLSGIEFRIKVDTAIVE